MLITFEGTEGSGKSTQISMLADYLSDMGLSVLATREPGGTRIGEQVRRCIHDVNNTEMTAEVEVLLYSASRSQLVDEVINPALAEEKIVLCDRYSDSTIAYQGYGRGLDLDTLYAITSFATGGLRPELTLLLDIEVQAGLARRADDAGEMNRMDLQTAAFYQRVRDGYMTMVANEPERWIVVDANRLEMEVQLDLRRLIIERLKLNLNQAVATE
jgi:dTMP kinase